MSTNYIFFKMFHILWLFDQFKLDFFHIFRHTMNLYWINLFLKCLTYYDFFPMFTATHKRAYATVHYLENQPLLRVIYNSGSFWYSFIHTHNPSIQIISQTATERKAYMEPLNMTEKIIFTTNLNTFGKMWGERDKAVPDCWPSSK